MKTLAILIILIITSSALATTWMTVKTIDPVSKDSVDVEEIASYGTYVYRWASKYDGIYWPFTDESFIRFNPKSGYIAFGSDFENIKDEELQKVKIFLKENYNPVFAPKTFNEKLMWLYKVYKVRGIDSKFDNRFYCLMAYLNKNNPDVSKIYRKRVIELLETYIKTDSIDFSIAQAYCVLGFNYKLFNNVKESKKYLDKLNAQQWKDENGEFDTKGKEYLIEIAKNISDGKYKDEYFGRKD
jgi:hypothetical protein